jgi:hypothetical protein
MTETRISARAILSRLVEVVRVIISVVAGFLLMQPLSPLGDLLHLRVFNSYALAHGYFIVVWPSLSVIVFFALGYFKVFSRYGNSAFILAASIWGLVLASYLDVDFVPLPEGLGRPAGFFDTPVGRYGLLTATGAVVCALTFFAERWIGIVFMVMLPTIVLRAPLIPDSLETVVGFFKYSAADEIGIPLLPIAAGCAVGLVARQLVRA